jgi:hypothetical protein
MKRLFRALVFTSICTFAMFAKAQGCIGKHPLSMSFFSAGELADVQRVASVVPDNAFTGRNSAMATHLAQLFNAKKGKLRERLTLSSPLYDPINDRGLALVFAGILSYELVEPCAGLDGKLNNTLDALDIIRRRNERGIVCQSFVSLAMQIYFQIMGDYSGVTITPFGTDRMASIDNHATLAASGTGVDLFVDPTTSLVAPVGFQGLLSRQRVPASSVVQFSQRQADTVSAFRVQLKDMLTQGQLDARSVSYVYAANTARFFDALPVYRTQRAPADFVRSVAWSQIGQSATWFVKGNEGSLWIASGSGLFDTGYRGVKALVSANKGIYVTLSNDVLLKYLPGMGGFGYVYSGNQIVYAKHIAPGLNNQSLWYIDSSGSLWLINADQSIVRANYGSTKAIVGTGDAVFMLTTYGQLFTLSEKGWSTPTHQVSEIYSTFPPFLDLSSAGLCRTTSDPQCRGHVVRLDKFNQTYGSIYYRDGQVANAYWNLINSGVYSMVQSYRGWNISYLKGTGHVCAYSPFAIWATGGGYRNELIPAEKWQPLVAGTASSMVFSYIGDGASPGLAAAGKFYLEAVDNNGNIFYQASDRWVTRLATPCPGAPTGSLDKS